MDYLNKSHVNLNQQFKQLTGDLKNNLNTSHVNLNQQLYLDSYNLLDI